MNTPVIIRYVSIPLAVFPYVCYAPFLQRCIRAQSFTIDCCWRSISSFLVLKGLSLKRKSHFVMAMVETLRCLVNADMLKRWQTGRRWFKVESSVSWRVSRFSLKNAAWRCPKGKFLTRNIIMSPFISRRGYFQDSDCRSSAHGSQRSHLIRLSPASIRWTLGIVASFLPLASALPIPFPLPTQRPDPWVDINVAVGHADFCSHLICTNPDDATSGTSTLATHLWKSSL